MWFGNDRTVTCLGMWGQEFWLRTLLYLSFAAPYQNTQGSRGENDPNNTTVRSLFYVDTN